MDGHVAFSFGKLVVEFESVGVVSVELAPARGVSVELVLAGLSIIFFNIYITF